MNELQTNLTPYFIENKYKFRVGPPRDGGYVLLQNDITPYIYSYGIAGNTECESHFLRIFGGKCKIEMFDGTIQQPNLNHPNAKFHRNNVYTFEDLSITENNATVMMDIEGSEYDVFMSITDLDCLDSIRQLSIEVHFNLAKKSVEGWNEVFRKINEKFYLVHIHANNHLHHPSYNDGIIEFHGIPAVIEVTYVNKNSFEQPLTKKEFRPFPLVGLDAPNYGGKPDIPLTWWCE